MVPSPRSATPAAAAAHNQQQHSAEVIPEPAMRTAEGHENFHTGRGGQGNVHREKYGGHSGPGQGEKLLGMAKHVLGLDKEPTAAAEREGSR